MASCRVGADAEAPRSAKRGLLARSPAPPICRHGKRGVCRFGRAACRWADSCHFCHICERVSTFDKIKRALSDGRRGPQGARHDVGSSRSGDLGAATLLRLLEVCPEVLLEGSLSDALPVATLGFLARAHGLVASLLLGPASLPLWRQRLRSLQPSEAGSSGLVLSSSVFQSLEVAVVRRCVAILRNVTFKFRWRIRSRAELDALVDAAVAARVAQPGARMFALSCAFGGRRGGHGIAGHSDDDGDDARAPADGSGAGAAAAAAVSSSAAGGAAAADDARSEALEPEATSAGPADALARGHENADEEEEEEEEEEEMEEVEEEADNPRTQEALDSDGGDAWLAPPPSPASSSRAAADVENDGRAAAREDDDEEGSEEELARSDMMFPAVMIPPWINCEPIMLPDNRRFVVVPMLTFSHRSSQLNHCALIPAILEGHGRPPSMGWDPFTGRNFSVEASVWTVEPPQAGRVQLRGLGLDRAVELDPDEDAGQAMRRIGALNLLVAVTCTRRYWELPLK
eukprot:TRINITY_DN16710_c0_g2_i1.p1 TRINITY_DN16710_c0_g2~~TRINITY_DN16710_c0_g2_i1.p1  ORF type:complete len:516 (-),score=123.83 TRINITY_DN16710_c0_g2_i1:33-1580(-)